MLRAAPKGATGGAVVLTADEDSVLRAAFGRYGGRAAARETAVAVVRRYQQAGSGQWFLCDCQPDGDRSPVLVPVAQTHIRRHQDDRWPLHAESCDFHREPAQQRALVASYAAPAIDRPMRLVRALDGAAAPLERELSPLSRDSARPGIARLLASLLTNAGLQRIDAGWRCPPLVDQIKAIWTAARAVQIDDGTWLPQFLCTSPARLGEVLQRIETAPAHRFVRSRPHGVLIARIAAFGSGALVPVSGAAIPVRGRIAVFGERAAAGRETAAERSARAPYLAACILGRASPTEPPEVLSAYVHPCASDTHLMLVDSNMERQTLAQLRSVQRWLGARKSMEVEIEKPLFDIGPVDQGDETTPPRPPCIPDYLIRARRRGDRQWATAVVETMGFSAPDYRNRKLRSHALMSVMSGGAPVVMHDFHEPAGQLQDWRDRRFWGNVRWTLTGLET